MANDPAETTSPEGTTPPPTDQTELVLTEPEPEETIQQPVPTRAKPRKKHHWSYYALMWFLGLVALAAIGFVVVNWNRQPVMDPAQTAAITWGDACDPMALKATCGGDQVTERNGRRWTVGEGTDDEYNFSVLRNERFASVAEIISLNECPPGPYCDALFARYGRTRAVAGEPPVAHAPLPPLPDTEPVLEETPAPPAP